MKKKMWIALALFGAVGLQAQTADQAALQLQGDGPYYRLRLPMGIFERAGYSSLDDLRVRNAAGLDVPMAWIDATAPEAETKEQAVPIFALPASSTNEPASMPVVIRTDGSLGIQRQTSSAPSDGPWLMDLSKLKGHLLRANFEIPAEARGLFQFQLDASSDLKHWQTVRDDGQLLRLSQGGDLLERLSLDLYGVQARYLRLRWMGAGVPLKSVHIESLQDAAALPALEWSASIAPTQCTDDHCDYRLPRNLPAQALRINLADVNTLARIEVIGLQDRVRTEPNAQHRRHVLRALRHSQRPATPSTDPLQQALFSTTVFRLKQPGGEALSGDLPLSGDVYASLRLRTTGPVAQLGAKPPTISVAVLPRSMVFLAQGQAPFSLKWVPTPNANLTMKPGPYLPIADLQKDGKAESIGVASVELPAFVAAAAPASAASVVAAPAPVNNRKVWLWGVMCIGLLLLALMARSLLRGLGKEPQDPAP